MANLSMTIAHTLDQEEALKRIKRLPAEIMNEYGGSISHLEQSWEGNIGNFQFKFSGFPVSGKVEVEKSQISLEMNLPFLAMPFKNKIESTIRRKADDILS